MQRFLQIFLFISLENFDLCIFVWCYRFYRLQAGGYQHIGNADHTAVYLRLYGGHILYDLR